LTDLGTEQRPPETEQRTKAPTVVVLAGGTGGAKLARGMLDVVGPDELAVVANTGDDVEIYRAYVSPDPDLVTFWLADRIDDRGWGLAGDTFHVMDGLSEIGIDVWFNLGDRDLAIGLERARALAAGQRLTEAQAKITRALGIKAQVLPMSDNPVRTQINAQGRWWPFQEFMIKARGQGPVTDVEFHGIRNAPATPEVLAAIDQARAVVIGPSNPAISIAPILETPGIKEALSRKPVVAVSPLVKGQVVKGPTDAFMRWMGRPLNSAGVAEWYEGVITGLVADDADAGAVPVHQTDVLMQTADDRRRVAEAALSFALTLEQPVA
jgi:LPPG:FO 2-phospho-L-lactate transferase